MLIIALVLAVIGLAALVFAVVTSNEFIAYVCIAASVLGVILLIVDALRERQRRAPVGGGDEPDVEKSVAKSESQPGPAVSDQGSQDDGRSDDSFQDYPDEADKGEAVQAESGAGSRPSETGAGASAEPGGSDEYDHGTAEQGAVGEDKPR